MNQSDIRGLVRLQTRADSDILRLELVLSFVMNSAITLPIICAKRILLLIVPAPVSIDFYLLLNLASEAG